MAISPDLVLGRRPSRYDAAAAASAGLYGGLVAGALLLVVAIAVDVALGRGPFAGLRTASMPFLGATAQGFGFAAGPVVVGLAAHAGLSLVFGLAFGLAAFGWQRSTVRWAGLLYGFVVYGFMSFVALPVALPSLVPSLLGFAPALLHGAWGLCLALAFDALRFRAIVPAGVRHRGATLTITPTLRPSH